MITPHHWPDRFQLHGLRQIEVFRLSCCQKVRAWYPIFLAGEIFQLSKSSGEFHRAYANASLIPEASRRFADQQLPSLPSQNIAVPPEIREDAGMQTTQPLAGLNFGRSQLVHVLKTAVIFRQSSSWLNGRWRHQTSPSSASRQACAILSRSATRPNGSTTVWNRSFSESGTTIVRWQLRWTNCPSQSNRQVLSIIIQVICI